MNNLFFTYSDCVILCNGLFPTNEIPLTILRNAKTIICCDGATKKLLEFGMEPTVIVGDLDSSEDSVLEKYADRVFHNADQETNDLTKSVEWAIAHEYLNITILGASGLREDHTLGNISLLVEYEQILDSVQIVTDFGVFQAMSDTHTFASFKGQQVSLFSIDPHSRLTGENLKYPLPQTFKSWWCGTLNEALTDSFTIQSSGSLIVFQSFTAKQYKKR